MSDRCILAVKYTSASAPKALRKAVGGFLRYVQYRDKHADSTAAPRNDPKVSGMLKYVAYRDRAASSGRLFGPAGPAGDEERRRLAAFVARGIAATRAQLANVDGKLVDRRRAVYRFVLSPERAEGLDLGRLTEAAVRRLEREARISGLHWIAAEHRNTEHPHIHLVLAGVREDEDGRFKGFILTPRRLAAMKEELTLEISRQRGEREPAQSPHPTLLTIAAPKQPLERAHRSFRIHLPVPRAHRRLPLFHLQLAALRYRRQLQQDMEQEARRQEREWSR